MNAVTNACSSPKNKDISFQFAKLFREETVTVDRIEDILRNINRVVFSVSVGHLHFVIIAQLQPF